jgi:hypothetical protein
VRSKGAVTRRVVVAILGVLAYVGPVAPGMVATAAPADATAASFRPGTYLVVLRARPLSTYVGGDAGYAATRPPAGRRFDVHSPAAIAYRKHLLAGQQHVLRRIGSPEPLYSYTAAVDGFAVELDSSQLKTIRTTPAVALVARSTRQHVAGAIAPRDAVRSTAARRAVATDASRPGAGRGVVIGVVDGGIWPENPSFAGLPMTSAERARQLPGFTGRCPDAQRWTSEKCNSKLIAARYFLRGFGADRIARSEFRSPRDATGHGSHIASVAAGNSGVAVTVDGRQLGRISGIAPGARIAVYKACWLAPNPSHDGCTTADLMAAVDTAFADGVDVLNYSVSADSATLHDPLQLAFANITAGGVFVAAAAGDNGSRSSSVDQPSPYVTTVGASALLRYRGTVVLADGRRLVGAMASGTRVRDRRLVAGRGAPAAGVSGADAAHCGSGTLRSRAVAGRIVVCERGTVPRLTMSHTVAAAGGAGMILANTAVRSSLDADLHAVPTVHLDRADGRVVLGYLARAGKDARASLVPGGPASASHAVPATFSARGPAAGAPGVLKPDLLAPGVSILGAVAPPSNFGRLWDLASGTSVAAPQVAGAAAVLESTHPAWSPAYVKSALLTTARPLDGTPSALVEGAGEVDLGRAVDPGLVYPGTGSTGNAATLAVAGLVGTRVVERTVRNVAAQPETYSIGVRGLHGIDVAVDPSVFTVQPGQTLRYRITLRANSRAVDRRYASGALVWNGLRGHRVRTPVVVAPAALRASPRVRGRGQRGTVDVPGRGGADGSTNAQLHGLVAARARLLLLVPGAFDASAPGASALDVGSFDVPAGTGLVRFEVDAGTSDTDLYLYRNGRPVDAATSSSPHETITIADPAAGRYDVYASVPSSVWHIVVAEFRGWVVPAASRRAASVPATIRLANGERFAVPVRWRGLPAGPPWLGYLTYGRTAHRTVVTIQP